jgi:2-phosphosulfolactate phosphatase
MKIDVIPFATAVFPKDILGKTVVVIDILRATSTIVNALQNGAKEIIPTLTVEEAFEKVKVFPAGKVLLGGERQAEKIPGFDMGNSYRDYPGEIVEGKSIILTTSNGTRALHACKDAKEVLIGSFLNLGSVVSYLQKTEEIVLLCSGTLGKFSIEDSMAAAAIIDLLTENNNPKLDDLGQSLLFAYRSKNGNLAELLKDGVHLNYLKSKGYEKDIEFCFQKNLFDILPIFNQEKRIVTL